MINYVPRGGGVADEDEDEYDEYEEEEEEEDEENESEEEEEEEDKDKVGKAVTRKSATDNSNAQVDLKDKKYDEPLIASPFAGMLASLGVMLLARKVDIFHPVIVRIARFLYIGYIVALQAFLLYVRLKVNASNNQAPITLTNPLSSVLQSQLGPEEGNNGIMKNIASSFLSSKSTVMEYDLKQAKDMQRGLIINMLFMWWLHFKQQHVQPLFIQSITGLINLLYSPLFQVYVLGRNLERPFKGTSFPSVEQPKPSPQLSGESKEIAQAEPSLKQVIKEVEEDSDGDTTEETETDSSDEEDDAEVEEEEVVVAATSNEEIEDDDDEYEDDSYDEDEGN